MKVDIDDSELMHKQLTQAIQKTESINSQLDYLNKERILWQNRVNKLKALLIDELPLPYGGKINIRAQALLRVLTHTKPVKVANIHKSLVSALPEDNINQSTFYALIKLLTNDGLIVKNSHGVYSLSDKLESDLLSAHKTQERLAEENG